MKLLISLLFSIFPRTLAAETLVLGLGSVLHIKSSAPRAWVGDGKIISLKSQADGFILYAKKLGQSQVRVGSTTKLVMVLKDADKKFYTKFNEAISKMEGLNINVDSNGVMVEGRLLAAEDWLQLYFIAAANSAQWRLRTEVDEALWQEVAAKIKQDLQDKGLAPLDFPSYFSPEIPVNPTNEAVYERYQQTLGQYGLVTTKDQTRLAIEPLVKLRILFAEVSKGFSRHFGIQWPAEFDFKLTPQYKAPSDWGITLRMVEQDQEGKILATPTLLCRSGAEAEFLAGGEIPMRVGGRKNQDVQWKKHGVLLKFKPKADERGALHIHLTTEFSVPDYSAAVDGIPGIKSNRVQSEFDLRQSRTILLSSLVKESVGQTKEGLPYLAQIPVLGDVLSSKSFNSGRTELVVLVRPELVREGQEQ